MTNLQVVLNALEVFITVCILIMLLCVMAVLVILVDHRIQLIT